MRVKNEEQVGPPKREYREDDGNNGGVFPHHVKTYPPGSGHVDLYVGIDRDLAAREAVACPDSSG